MCLTLKCDHCAHALGILSRNPDACIYVEMYFYIRFSNNVYRDQKYRLQAKVVPFNGKRTTVLSARLSLWSRLGGSIRLPGCRIEATRLIRFFTTKRRCPFQMEHKNPQNKMVWGCHLSLPLVYLTAVPSQEENIATIRWLLAWPGYVVLLTALVWVVVIRPLRQV